MARESLTLEAHVGITSCLLLGLVTHHIAVPSGPYLDAGRNRCIANAYEINNRIARGETIAEHERPWDWFVFQDSDVEGNPDTLRTLMAPTCHPDYDPIRYPVIGGVYINPFEGKAVPGEEDDDLPNAHFGPVTYELILDDDLPGELNGTPTPNLRRYSRTTLATLPPVDELWNPPGTDVSPSPVCRVDAIGTGYLAIHRSLLDTMGQHYGEPLPWFDEPVRDGVHYGEDMGFALRCRDLGYPVLAHRGCTPLHHKTTKLI